LGRRDDDVALSSGAVTSRRALVVAVLVSVIVGSFVPFGGVLLYPFTLLATWVHEMGHGLTAIVVGGAFDHLEIFADASGLAYTSHPAGARALGAWISLGGLVAPPIVGAIVLATARGPRRAQIVLVSLAFALLASLLIWVRSSTGFIAVPLVAAVVLLFIRWGGPSERMFLAQFVGLRLALDTVGRGMDYIFTGTATIGGVKRASDIATVAEGFGGPRLVWSVIVATFCLSCVGVGLWGAWRKGASGDSPRPKAA
jgi:hypothetical protein